MTRYLSVPELLIIHALVIDETSGSHGVRDTGLLESITLRPQSQYGGQEMYVGIFSKAAVLAEAIVNYHVFVDGNKRTGFMAMARFLHMNGYTLETEQTEVEQTMVAIARKEIPIDKLSSWIEKNSVKLVSDS